MFAPEFRNPKNMHLRNFFIILPPLVRLIMSDHSDVICVNNQHCWTETAFVQIVLSLQNTFYLLDPGIRI